MSNSVKDTRSTASEQQRKLSNDSKRSVDRPLRSNSMENKENVIPSPSSSIESCRSPPSINFLTNDAADHIASPSERILASQASSRIFPVAKNSKELKEEKNESLEEEEESLDEEEEDFSSADSGEETEETEDDNASNQMPGMSKKRSDPRLNRKKNAPLNAPSVDLSNQFPSNSSSKSSSVHRNPTHASAERLFLNPSSSDVPFPVRFPSENSKKIPTIPSNKTKIKTEIPNAKELFGLSPLEGVSSSPSPSHAAFPDSLSGTLSKSDFNSIEKQKNFLGNFNSFSSNSESNFSAFPSFLPPKANAKVVNVRIGNSQKNFLVISYAEEDEKNLEKNGKIDENDENEGRKSNQASQNFSTSFPVIPKENSPDFSAENLAEKTETKEEEEKKKTDLNSPSSVAQHVQNFYSLFQFYHGIGKNSEHGENDKNFQEENDKNLLNPSTLTPLDEHHLNNPISPLFHGPSPPLPPATQAANPSSPSPSPLSRLRHSDDSLPSREEDKNKLGIKRKTQRRQYYTLNSHSKRKPKQRKDEIHFNDLVFLEKIGEGSFGEVFRGTLWGQEVAIKKLRIKTEMNEERMNSFKKEVRIMRTLRHPNIVEFLGATVEPPNLCIVTEFLSRGSLEDVLKEQMRDGKKKLSLKRMILLAKDIARGLNWLHHLGIIHRDLKSANILMDQSGRGKLADFGLSHVKRRLGRNEGFYGACGTPCYMAPEVLKRQAYGVSADTFSFGVCLCEMLIGKYPYENEPESTRNFEEAIISGLRPLVPEETPVLLKELIENCWNADPLKRPKMDGIMDTLIMLERQLNSNENPSFSNSLKTDDIEELQKLMEEEKNELQRKFEDWKEQGKMEKEAMMREMRELRAEIDRERKEKEKMEFLLMQSQQRIKHYESILLNSGLSILPALPSFLPSPSSPLPPLSTLSSAAVAATAVVLNSSLELNLNLQETNEKNVVMTASVVSAEMHQRRPSQTALPLSNFSSPNAVSRPPILLDSSSSSPGTPRIIAVVTSPRLQTMQINSPRSPLGREGREEKKTPQEKEKQEKKTSLKEEEIKH